jgi:hypothetical protein
VTSPNEPGYPRKGESPNGNGSVDRSGTHRAVSGPADGVPETGDVSQRQRGPARAPHAGPRPSPEPLAPHDMRPPSHPWNVEGSVEARLPRFAAGPAAPGIGSPGHAQIPSLGGFPREREVPAPASGGESGAVSARSAPPQQDTYASELPDLSGPIPRSTQRKAAYNQAPDASTSAGQGYSAGLESRAQMSWRSRGPVRASMQIRRIDPWSILKVSLLLSVALFFVWMIAVAFLYLVLGAMGVWSKLNSNVGDLLNNASGGGELVSSGTIFSGAALIGLANIVLLTTMATIGAFVYNLTTDLIGGVEVTLADRD